MPAVPVPTPPAPYVHDKQIDVRRQILSVAGTISETGNAPTRPHARITHRRGVQQRVFPCQAVGLVSYSPGTHPYIGAVTLNGKPLERVYLHHAEILAGGELNFSMQAQPNKQWGTTPDARPAATSPYGP
ncbi:MAG: hypothetical protein WDW36_000121 [Sanguina aurantia]